MAEAGMTLSVDTSDCWAVIKACERLYERLAWPHRERFRAEVQALIEAENLVTFEEPPRGPALVAFASADLLDVMRKYDGK